ncbi:hypothetical protein [Magnetofaba australis]|uniref:Uncharacterized protein n=1 Tax=Magnetofaba australis IT-1 TaxID=1434232 RepID=A0A1Y2K2V5_9PROT|nr:hypothetical protein [Magnetofaba australis]OSM01514.1 hypothetical protein MAIT1_01500 [Magnetofaba australis IT-1]
MVHTEIDLSKRLIVASFSGEIGYAELQEWQLGLSATPDFAPDFFGVADFRRASVRITTEGLQRIDQISAERLMPSGKWALLVNSPHEAALAAQYIHIKNDKHPLSYFNTVRAASEYLGVDLSEYLRD